MGLGVVLYIWAKNIAPGGGGWEWKGVGKEERRGRVEENERGVFCIVYVTVHMIHSAFGNSVSLRLIRN